MQGLVRLILGGFALLWPAVMWAALTPDQEASAKRLIEQLADNKYEVREAACAKLVEMGRDVLPLVTAALESEDPERKTRAQVVIRGIREKFPLSILPREQAQGVPVDLAKPSLVTLKVQDAKLSDVLAEVARQTGNKPLGLPAGFAGKPVTVAFDKTPYWEAVDELCKGQDLKFYPDYEKRGMVLTAAGGLKESISYAGPVVFKLDPTRARQRQDAWTYTVRVVWEDRLAPGGYFLTGNEVQKVTVGGEQVPGDQVIGAPGMGMRAAAGLVQVGPPTASFQFTFRKGEEKGQRMADVSGTAKVRFARGARDVCVEDAFAEGEKSGKSGPYELKVLKVEDRQEKGVTFSVQLLKDGQSERVTDYGSDPLYGVWLVGPDGNKYRGQLSSGVQTSVNVQGGPAVGMAVVIIDGRPVQVGGGGVLRYAVQNVTFTDLPSQREGCLLAYVYAAEVVEQEYGFQFTQIPMP